MLLLVTASWAGPARPAATVQHELGRRWGTAVRMATVQEPAEDALRALAVEELPTWLLLRSFDTDRAYSDDGVQPEVLDLDGITALAAPTSPPTAETAAAEEMHALSGRWSTLRRRVGALPKHEVDRMLREAGRGDHASRE